MKYFKDQEQPQPMLVQQDLQQNLNKHHLQQELRELPPNEHHLQQNFCRTSAELPNRTSSTTKEKEYYCFTCCSCD